MSRLYNQVSECPEFHYNRGFNHGYDYAAFERQKAIEAAWQWYEHLNDEDEVEQSFTLADGTVFTEKQRRH